MRRFLAASEAISRAAGVTQQQYQALLAIQAWSPEAMTMKDLADQLLLTHHAAVQLVNRLTKAGRAARAPSPSDGRSVGGRAGEPASGRDVAPGAAAHPLLAQTAPDGRGARGWFG
jgi:hypothetical protein